VTQRNSAPDRQNEDLSSKSDDSDGALMQDESSVVDEGSGSDADSTSQIDTHDLEQDAQRDSKVIIYFRPKAGISSKQSSAIKDILRADYPDAVVLLETATKNSRSTYSSRVSLNRLMNHVLDQTVKEILVADSNHICSTKDGFQLFCWICDFFGTKVLVSPALQLQ